MYKYCYISIIPSRHFRHTNHPFRSIYAEECEPNFRFGSAIYFTQLGDFLDDYTISLGQQQRYNSNGNYLWGVHLHPPLKSSFLQLFSTNLIFMNNFSLIIKSYSVNQRILLNRFSNYKYKNYLNEYKHCNHDNGCGQRIMIISDIKHSMILCP